MAQLSDILVVVVILFSYWFMFSFILSNSVLYPKKDDCIGLVVNGHWV